MVLPETKLEKDECGDVTHHMPEVSEAVSTVSCETYPAAVDMYRTTYVAWDLAIRDAMARYG